ncbi:hypothetical protein OTB20_03495 [Streptomyces sp. H27-H1]|uniref:hypothetical protein n=1 Tax=Streptomyces sp. H27-H1 TaxID=2996461 RepID=UPI002271C1EA|nr:hypothetical protein [Streptomyces sp. H27-H1]MCY0925285.1 hypothetical protein [Streptomyces sp. H27-H1]
MRPVRELGSSPATSHTPIYDTLYSEYLRAFRALPGDRTGEEDLGFTAFSYGGPYNGTYGSGTGSYGSGSAAASMSSYGSGWNASAWQQAAQHPGQQTDPWQPSPAPQPQYSYAGAGYANGRQHQTGMQHIPAALPPAPRRGH